MTKVLHCCYNMDTNCVELIYNDGSVLSIDCEEVENAYDVTNRQMADLDWLLYNAPMEYAIPVVGRHITKPQLPPAVRIQFPTVKFSASAATRTLVLTVGSTPGGRAGTRSPISERRILYV